MSVTSLMYDRSRAAGDNALSAPPGIAEFLQVKGQCPIKRSPALGHKSIHRTTGRGKKAGRRSLCEQHVVNVIQVRSILKRKNTKYLRFHRNAAHCMEHICHLSRLDTNGHWNGQSKFATVHIRLDFMPLEFKYIRGQLHHSRVQTLHNTRLLCKVKI